MGDMPIKLDAETYESTKRLSEVLTEKLGKKITIKDAATIKELAWKSRGRPVIVIINTSRNNKDLAKVIEFKIGDLVKEARIFKTPEELSL